MSPAPRRPTVRLHDVSVSGAGDPDAVLDAVREAVAGAAAGGTPTQEGVRSAIASAVASPAAPSVDGRGRT